MLGIERLIQTHPRSPQSLPARRPQLLAASLHLHCIGLVRTLQLSEHYVLSQSCPQASHRGSGSSASPRTNTRDATAVKEIGDTIHHTGLNHGRLMWRLPILRMSGSRKRVAPLCCSWHWHVEGVASYKYEGPVSGNEKLDSDRLPS